MGRLEGKVAIVTGSSRMRGIGRAIAVRLAEEGADVVVTGRSDQPERFPAHEQEAGWKGAHSTAEEIAALGRKALPLIVDVTKKEEVKSMVEKTLQEFGRVDILVNNAGLAGVTGGKSILELDDNEWYREIDVNLNGVYLTCKAVAAALVAAGEGGRIINISSVAGKAPSPNFGAYCATKAAVISFTQMLALELAPYGINVNVVCPGFTETDMSDGTLRRTAARTGTTFDSYKAEFAQDLIPLGRQARPSEIASFVAYLASPEATYITAQAMNVDGGLVLH